MVRRGKGDGCRSCPDGRVMAVVAVGQEGLEGIGAVSRDWAIIDA